MKRFLFVALCLPMVSLMAATPADLEFQEGFAWGDRAAALKELVPDTEDYFYYHCLHYQLAGDRASFQRTLQQWLGKNNNNWNERMQEMRRRQMLLDFGAQPEATWSFLRDDLGLTFPHRPRNEQRTVRYPSQLKPEQVAPDVFMNEAKRLGLLDHLTPRGVELALGQDLNADLRRAFLGRLDRPDYPGLVELIAADLEYKDSRGFGHHNVHRLLTREQLEALGKRRPALLREEAYVAERLARIPLPEADLTQDHAAAVSYYQAVWAFVQTLEPMHNSLKASVLYQLLSHQRCLGTYDEALFVQYLELPRPVPYLLRERQEELRRQRQGAEWVNFNYQPGQNAALPPIGNEEPLVREFLLELLADAPDASRFLKYFEARWLDALLAESKILHGVGKPEDWASRLSPAAYRAILDRVELNFAPQNKTYVKPGDAVSLLVDVKRVDSLRVKIYEMQTFNYYTTHQAPVDQAVDLDGMIATHERTLKVATDPGRRIRHTLELPEIAGRGVYVVELIGNGVSSRALLHVGHLESISQATAAGQALLVLNDAGETVKKASVWMNGREFTANDQGLILLPYSENPGVRFTVLRDGEFCSPEQIQHLGETYRFAAGIHLDPQNLVRRTTGTLLLRPDLRLHGIPLDPALLGKVQVTLAATDAKGIRTEREYTAEFARHAEWTSTFYVPEGLRLLEVSVEAKIKRKSDLEEITLTDAYALPVNPARAGDVLKQVFLTPSAGGWALEVRGLNGEEVADVPLMVQLFHPAFTRPVDCQVTTDAQGRVELGTLAGLSSIQVSGPDNVRLAQALSGGAAVFPERLHLMPKEAVSLPYPFENTPGLKTHSLFLMRDGKILADVSDQVKLADGQVAIAGLAAGEYALILHEPGARITLAVEEGMARNGYILGLRKRLQQTGLQLPSVAAVKGAAEDVTVTLRNVTPSTRVAVRAYRYAGPGSEFPNGEGFAPPSHRRVFPPYVQYVSGRNIGDEYRYVLDRRDQTIYAGSLLDRPGLILNPWELRETSAELEQLKQDQDYRRGRQVMNAPVVVEAEMAEKTMDGRARFGGFASRRAKEVGGDRYGDATAVEIGFDFLAQGSRWWANLKPAADGTVTIPIKDLGEHTALDVVVVDRFGASRQRLLLTDRGYEPRDVRLRSGLKPEASFSRQKTVRVLDPKEPAVFPDFATTRYQVIRTVGQAYDLLQTLSGDAALVDFAFLKDWPKLDDEAKRKKYGEFACHELHLFLYERDRAFFDAVVRPYLANKKDKTFVDRWLLGALTPEDTRLDRLQRRNALELALLARRGGDANAVREALREAWELLPPDPEAFARLVRVALQASELDETASLARDKAQTMAEKRSDFIAMGAASGLVARAYEGAAMAADMVVAPATAVPPAGAKRPKPAAPAESLSFGFAEDAGGKDLLMDMRGEVLAGEAVRLYRALPKTKEWAEQNYYKLREQQDLPERIPVNAFWRQVAAGDAIPASLLEANRNLTEVLTAIAFCGLPFDAVEPEEKPEGAQMTVSVKTPALLVSEQILPAASSADDRPLLLSQQFFRPDDLYRYEGNEQIEKFVAGEFIRRAVYGARVTLTNPTASRRRLNLLLQIPLGAVPLRNGFYTDDMAVTLEPYTTQKMEYFFTFPAAGEFGQFPAHAAADEAIVGKAEPRLFRVVDAPTEVDKTSWGWVSQYAAPEEVLAFLKAHNLRRLNLDEMAWRLKDLGFFKQATDLLVSRAWFHDTTFSYAVFHKDVERTKIWLARNGVRSRVGPVLASPLLVVEPVDEKTYEHLEYDPLVNPRVHPVGDKRKILNTALDAQYRAFLRNGFYRAGLNAAERLGLVYYLLLQDRLTEAGEQLEKIGAAETPEKLQGDYLRAWLALRNLDLDRALALAKPHVEHPVPRWRSRYQALAQAVKEARGAESAVEEDPSRQQDLDRQAAQMPSVELKIESGKLMVTTHNLKQVTLNLYPMDIELLFSRKPFLAEGGSDFAVIKPAFTQAVTVKGRGDAEEIELPKDYRDRNLMVEVTGKGQRASVAWYANRLRVRKMESYGQVEVRSAADGKPLPKTYVKVFARGVDGRETFWKDGYTDLRGRFDYLSHNDRKPEEAAEFSLLILHPELGAEIRDAKPPTR